jgi:hypothetical protein
MWLLLLGGEAGGAGVDNDDAPEDPVGGPGRSLECLVRRRFSSPPKDGIEQLEKAPKLQAL